MKGIEPLTYALRERRSTPELHRREDYSTHKTFFWSRFFHPIIFSMLLMVLGGCNLTESEQPRPGVFNLSSMDHKSVYVLDGFWEFYWHKDDSKYYVNFPGFWNTKLGLPAFGSAWYQATIILPPSETQIVIGMGDVHSAYELYWNGQLQGSMGNVNIEGAQGAHIRSRTFFVRGKGENTLRLKISNYFNVIGGTSEHIRIGSPESVLVSQRQAVNVEIITTGIFLFLGLYYFIYAIFSRKDPAYIFLTVLIFSIAFRTVLMGQRLIFYVLPWIETPMANFFEYLTVIIISVSFFSYSYLLEKHKAPLYLKGYFILSAIYTLLLIVLPFPNFSSIFHYYIYCTLGVLITVLLRILFFKPLPVFNRKIFLLSLVSLIISGIYDFLIVFRGFNTIFILPFGTLIFLLLQAFLLNGKRNKSLIEIHNMKEEITQKSHEQTEQLIKLMPTLTGSLKELNVHVKELGEKSQLNLSEYGMKRLQYLQHFFTRWIKSGKDVLWSELEELLKELPELPITPVIQNETNWPKILVVDDERINRLLLSTQLQKEGAIVLTAENGASAIDLLGAHQFDLLLLDIMMYPLSGYEFVHLAHQKSLTLPTFYYLTAKTSVEDLHHGLSLGAMGFWTKPFSIKNIFPKIKTVLNIQDYIRRIHKGDPKIFYIHLAKNHGEWGQTEIQIISYLVLSSGFNDPDLSQIHQGVIVCNENYASLFHRSIVFLISLGALGYDVSGILLEKSYPGFNTSELKVKSGLVVQRELTMREENDLYPEIRVQHEDEKFVRYEWEPFLS